MKEEKGKKEACTARSREVAQPSTDVARDCLISRFGVELDVSSRVWPLRRICLSLTLIPGFWKHDLDWFQENVWTFFFFFLILYQIYLLPLFLLDYINIYKKPRIRGSCAFIKILRALNTNHFEKREWNVLCVFLLQLSYFCFSYLMFLHYDIVAHAAHCLRHMFIHS